MIPRPFRRSTTNGSIAALYGAIVAQARSPAFYEGYEVPDTVQGRFELIVLHLVLTLRRVRRDEGDDGDIGRRLFETFCRDLDANLREMGVGDLAVPKRMRHFGEAFYGRQRAYLAALDEPEPQAFEKALARNILGSDAVGNAAAQLACYARTTARELDAQDDRALVRGEVRFPNPEAFAHARA